MIRRRRCDRDGTRVEAGRITPLPDVRERLGVLQAPGVPVVIHGDQSERLRLPLPPAAAPSVPLAWRRWSQTRSLRLGAPGE